MKKIKMLASFATLLLSGAVLAQPGTTVGTDSDQVGNTVTVPVAYLGTGSGVVGVQMDIGYDTAATALGNADLTNCGATLGGTAINCTQQASSIRLTGFSGTLTEIPSGSLGTITFTIGNANAAPFTYNLTVQDEVYSNAALATVPPLGSVNGSVDVVAGPQPDYSSNPVGGSTLTFNGAVGGADPTNDVIITNAGSVGAPNLTGNCALSGVNAASFSITSSPAIAVAQGANQTMTVSCNASVVAAGLTASLDCTHNGDGTTEPSPVSYPLTCDIAAITPQYNSTPAGGSAIAMGSILQGGANPTASIDIDNDAGDATTTLTGTCTAPAPFIVTNGAFSVLQGAAADTVDIACDSSVAPAAYAEDLTCTHNGSNVASPVTYPMTCEVLAAAAAGDQNPVGGTALSVVVAPGGSATTSVTFSEVGGQGVDITNLDCSVTPGVGFAITSPAAFPATIPAGGSMPVVVTFTDPGDGSATPGSLECTYTDGAGPVALSYPLNFIIRAVNVPTLSVMGYIVLTLGFGLIGFFAFRRRA